MMMESLKIVFNAKLVVHHVQGLQIIANLAHQDLFKLILIAKTAVQFKDILTIMEIVKFVHKGVLHVIQIIVITVLIIIIYKLINVLVNVRLGMIQ